jgi:hypothetical protein
MAVQCGANQVRREHEVSDMCLTCGCGDAHQKMGKNVTYEDLRDVAVENSKPVDEILRVMTATAAQDRTQHSEEYSQQWRTESMSRQ